MRRSPLLALAIVALASCKTSADRPHGKRPVDLPGAAITAPSTSARAVEGAPSAESSSAAPSATASATSAPATSANPSASASAPRGAPGDVCTIARGPIQLPFTASVTIFADPDGETRMVVNRDGAPHPVSLPAAQKPAKSVKPGEPKKPERLALGEPAERIPGPGCAVAGGYLFCIDKSGNVQRSTLKGEDRKAIAQARPGSPIAASPIGGSHVVYAFLADRRTTEGATTLAFAALDDGPPVTLSEDGAGATFVTLAPRGEEAIAMYVDARRVLTPVHARVLDAKAGKLALGSDAVLFVGGGTDGRTHGALGVGAGGHELALLPIDKDDKEFGLAAIRIEEKPRDDAAVTWSPYPAAMDRPAVAATQGAWPIRVLRTRPSAPDPKSKKVLELGEVDAAGVFKANCAVAEGDKFADLAIFADRGGSLWIAYTDADGTWVERRGK
jgi:hypothetical protein